MKLHHIGIATLNIKNTIKKIDTMFGLKNAKPSITYDPIQHAQVSLLESKGNTAIELISGRKVAKLIKKGISYYHLCYETKHMDNDIKKMKASGAIFISKKSKASLFNNRKVIFFYTSIGIIELLESPS